MEKVEKILDKHERKKRGMEEENKRKSDIDDRINTFLQDKFNERYVIIMMLIFIPIGFIYSFWVVYGNTFNDGFIRFFIGFFAIAIMINSTKVVLLSKLKKEYFK